MRIARPNFLELEYQRQMMACALFLPEPRCIVQLGLGAGALTKFCYRHVSSAKVIVVELSKKVIDAAKRWFYLPDEDERLRVVQADALNFISNPKNRGTAEWLQVDLYDSAARGPVYDDVRFYRACRIALTTPGVACFNLFGRRFDPSFAAIAMAFNDRALLLPEADAGNRIVLAFSGPPLEAPIAALMRRADQLEDDWKLPARRWVSGLRDENGFDSDLVI